MTAIAQHTPGPWRVVRSRDRFNPHDLGIARDGIRTVLAECYAEFHAKGDFRPAEAEANARLVAAAPDLLAATLAALPFIAAVAWVQMESLDAASAAEVWEQLRAAIAKAEAQP